MNQANSTKLIPYGMTDFPAIIRNNYYYVDKTEYIRQIEQTARPPPSFREESFPQYAGMLLWL